MINYKKKNRKPIILLSLIFLISRFIILFFSPYIYSDEESKRGSLGHDIVFNKELRMPIFGYMGSSHAGGGLLVQIETIPAYIIFGDKYIALKITAILNSLLLFLLILLLIDKYFSKSELYITAIALILGTPHYLQKNLMIWGNSIFFALFLIIGIRFISNIIIDQDKSKKNYAYLGFILGFGLWVQYGFLALIFTVVIIFLLLYKQLKRFNLLMLSGFFVIGFSPWIIYNLIYGFPSVFGDIFITSEIDNFSFYPKVLIMFYTFLSELLPKSFHFLDFGFFSAKTLAYSLYFIIILTTIFGAKYYKKSLSLNSKSQDSKRSAVFFLVLMFIVIAIIPYNFIHLFYDTRNTSFNLLNDYTEFYMLFYHPFLLILFGLGLSSIIRKPNLKIVGYIMLIITVIIMTMGFVSILNASPNYFLLKPMHNSENLAFDFARHIVIYLPTYKKFYQQIEHDMEIREYYAQGSAQALLYFNDIGRITDKSLRDINQSIMILDENEKAIFFQWLLKEKKRENYQSYKESIDSLYNGLNERDKKIFEQVDMEIENSTV